jgi:hypothetical protein
MKLVLSKKLVLGDWYRTDAVGDWIRQEDGIAPLSFSEHAVSDVTRVYFHQTVSDSFSFVFSGQLRFLNRVYRDLYGEELAKIEKASFFSHDQAEEAKKFVDSFITHVFKMRAFI